MKKYVVFGVLCTFFLVGSSSAYATSPVEPSPEKSQTEVTVGLTRKITANKLPGGEEQTLNTKPMISPNKTLPQTGEKTTSVYLLLGIFFTIFSLLSLCIKKMVESVTNYETQ